MGIFGESRNEKVTREAYVLLWNAAERLKEGLALYDNLETVANKAAWINRKDLERTAESLIKYGTALASTATGVLGGLPEFESPLLSVAVSSGKEKAILELFYKTEALQIRNDVHDFNEQDDEVPSIGKVLRDIISEKH